MAVLFWMILTYPFGETSHDMEALLSQSTIPFAVILGNVYLIFKERYSPYAMLNGVKKAIVQKRLIGTPKGRHLKD